jgi:hypothetical protein
MPAPSNEVVGREHTRACHHQRAMRDRLLTAAALAWLGAVVLIALFGFGIGPAEVGSSPDTLTDGRIPRMLASSLLVEDDLRYAQLALLLFVSLLLLMRAGAVTWWLAALLGHLGSAVLAYAIIGLAVALGSGSAEAATDDWDYGISCVLSAQLAALAYGAWRARARGSASPLDSAILLLAAGSLIFFVVTIGWYGVEHLFAFAIGLGVAAWRRDR